MENRPVDPGSIKGSHRPISFIRIKHRIRANDIFCKTEYFGINNGINNHIVGLVHKNHSLLYERVWCTTRLAKLSFNHSNGRTHSCVTAVIPPHCNRLVILEVDGNAQHATATTRPDMRPSVLWLYRPASLPIAQGGAETLWTATSYWRTINNRI